MLAIAAAELGDKTQISILLLSSKTKKHIHILLGAMLGFALVDGLAIIAGSWITTVIPIDYLKIIAAVVFIVLGIIMFFNTDDDEKEITQRTPFLTAFLIITLTEWGDKTQIAAALFATQYEVIFVFLGTMTALTILTIVAIFFGRFISSRVNKRLVNRVAGIVFIILGIAFFVF